jgi:hypothetical protein
LFKKKLKKIRRYQMPNIHVLRIAQSTLLILLGTIISSAYATDYTWGGGDHYYTNTTATGWNGGPPNLGSGDTATINSGTITYIPGVDFSVAQGGILTMNGGKFIQGGGGSWMNLGQNPGTLPGTIIINSGAEFNMGTAGKMRMGYYHTDNSLLHINGGTFDSDGGAVEIGQTDSDYATLRSSGNATVIMANIFLYNNLEANGGTLTYNSLTFGNGSSTSGSFSIGGADVTGSGNLTVGSGYTLSMTNGSLSLGTSEFQATGGDSSISGGILNANLLSLAGDTIEFSGGTINLLDGTASEGISAGAGDYLNFTEDSTGILFIDNLDESGLNTLLSDGCVRYDGEIIPEYFHSTPQDDGFIIDASSPQGTIISIM